jgi:hypothetical protein
MIETLRKSRILNFGAILAIFGIVIGVYLFLARPYQLTWGATNEEIQRPMPGDELDPAPDFLATRAVTINAPPDEIWPWLIQMAYNRAGFYGYDILENIGSERGLRSAEEIIPEFQNFNVGDEVPISALHSMVFYAIEPNEYLIWAGKQGPAPGGFTWALYPIDETQTRLVSRIRWSYQLDQPGAVALAAFTDLTDHIAVRKILQGIKGRVEGRIEPMLVQNIEFILYVATFVLFVYGLVVVVLCPLTWQRWLMAVGAGLIWMLSWYASIPIGVSGLLILLIGWMLLGVQSRK